MFGSRRGISQTPFLIVFIILFLGATIVAYFNGQGKNEQMKIVEDLNAQMEAKDDQFREKVQELQAWTDITGFYKEEDPVEARDVQVVQSHLESSNKKLSPVLPPRNLNCKALIDELSRQIEVRDRRLEEADLNTETKNNKIQELEQTKIRLVREKQDRIDKLIEDHQRNQKRLELTIQGYERQVTDLRERIKTYQADNERIAQEARVESRKLETEIKSLQARVIALSRREQIEETPMPDGRVTRADIDQGYAYIDLGSTHGVQAGQRFKVYSVLKGGRRKEKGEIRVTRVEKDFSQCSILVPGEETDPIVMGDYIWNRFFVPGRQLVFCFVGNFGGDHVQHTKDQLKRLVQQAGHVATDKVHADTYYAVLGEDYVNDPEYKKVQDYRVAKINPRELFEHLGVGKFE